MKWKSFKTGIYFESIVTSTHFSPPEPNNGTLENLMKKVGKKKPAQKHQEVNFFTCFYLKP